MNKATFKKMIDCRDKALLSLNRAKILGYIKKWSDKDEYESVRNADDKTFWASVHKARMDCTTLSEATRNESRQWLADKGWN